MGSLGFGEIFLIIFIAAIIFGPNQLPELARSLGKAIKEFKSMINRIDMDVKDEVESIKKSVDFHEMSDILEEVNDINKSITDVKQTVSSVKSINPMTYPFKPADDSKKETIKVPETFIPLDKKEDNVNG